MHDRTWQPICMMLLSIFVGVGMAHAEPPRLGEKAPEFRLRDIDGEVRSLADYRGSFVVLEWFNPECPFMRKHYDSGSMQQLQGLYSGQDMVWLTIDSSAPGRQGYLTSAEAHEVLAREGAKPTAMILDPDGTLGRLYGAKTTPHMFIIDPEGMLIYHGAIDDTPSTSPGDVGTAINYVQATFDQALAGEPVSTPASQPYGCSVKY